MIGLMIDEKERQELEYLLKMEMDEILADLKDERLDHLIKRAVEEKYSILFRLFKKVSSEHEWYFYMRKKQDLSKRLK